MFDVITIGDATIDTFLVLDETDGSVLIDKKKQWLSLHYGEKTPIKETDQSVGGNAPNVAVGLRRLGLTTAIVTELGDDLNGQVLHQELERAEVDTRFVKLLPGKETRYSVVLTADAERTILSYYAPRTYTLPKLSDASWIYYTSLGPTFERLQKKLVSYLDEHPQTLLAINPGSHQLKKGVSDLKKILGRTTLLILNVEEAVRFLGKKMSVPRLVHALHRRGPSMVVITDGTRGSYASTTQGILHMPPYPIKPVARTGAGDAYASAFLAAMYKGKSLPEAMQWGSANAASVIQQIGAQKGLQSTRGILKLIAAFPNLVPTPVSD